MMHGWYGGYGMNPWGGGFMMFIGIILIGVVIYFLLKNNNMNNDKSDKSIAFQLLDEKYVSGEITEEEYLHKKRMLKK